MAKLKLTYFNARRRAEPIRFILAYADVDYEDIRIDSADWPTLRESFPFHKLPILEVDGQVLNQSMAIARYLGKRFGLVVDDPFKEALLEALVENLRDLEGKHAALQQKTPEVKKDYCEAMKLFLDSVEPVASEGYFYGSEPTWVDIEFAEFADSVKVHTCRDILKSYPNLTSLVNNIKNKDSLKKYIENRPTFPFHKVPVLEVDEKVLNQSVAIARYLGKRFNLVTNDPFKEALLEALVDDLSDLQLKIRAYLQLKTPETKKECDEAMTFFFNYIEPVASEGFFYGSEPTWVDINFAGFSDALKVHMGSDILKSYPNLIALVDKIKSNDSVKKYIESRPVDAY